MATIKRAFPVGRIIKVLRATNFITIKAAAAKSSLSSKHLGKLENEEQTRPTDETLDKITTCFNITPKLLKELKALEQQLEVYLEDQTNIEDEKKELLILQALAHKVLEYYLKQTNSPENLLTIIKSVLELPEDTENKDFQRIIKILLEMNFIQIKTLASNADISPNCIYMIKDGTTSPTNRTLNKIATCLKIPPQLLQRLKKLEQKLEEYLAKQTNIEAKEKELLILRALEYGLLEYYHSQAISQNHYPKNLFSTPRHK